MDERYTFTKLILEQELKTGQNSRVCLVRRDDTGQRCIYRSFTGTAEVYRGLMNVECPHLPRILAVKEESGTVHVLEEYIQGDTLAFLLKGGTLLPDQARNILLHVCKGLQTLHSIGAVHRDVKPENIILRGDEAVLIDFDASRLSDPKHEADTKIMGTVGYAAPEQYGFTQTDARTDIYSMGILLNVMLTGEHPSRTLAEGPFRPVIERCTRINAEQRYGSVEELIRAVRRVRTGRSPALVPAALFVTMLLAVCMILFFRPGPGSAPETTVPTQLSTVSTQETLAYSPPQTEELVIWRMSDTPWEGEVYPHSTYFEYDSDRNGEVEYYDFAIRIADLGTGSGDNAITETTGTGFTQTYRAYPCVLSVRDNDMEMESMKMAEVLKDIRLTIYRKNDLDSAAPFISPQNAVWPGDCELRFTPEQDGTWVLEASAKVNGQELHSVFTITFRCDPDHVRWDGVIRPWPNELTLRDGNYAGQSQTFSYDLDGDGVPEQYLFGVDYVASPPKYEVDYDVCSNEPGDTPRRDLYGCVWRIMPDGTKEVEEAFTELLSLGNAALWEISAEGSPAPSVKEVDYKWPGALSVTFHLQKDASWMYEVTAYLGDTKLQAWASFTFHVGEYFD